MTRRAVIDWLLEEDDPSVRYLTLTELLGRPGTDPEVHDARQQIRTKGWGREMLAERVPGAEWADGKSPYRPKHVSTNWKMLVLADLGFTRKDRVVRELCEYWMKGLAAKGGALGGNSGGTPHYCVAANMARALIQFGYADDPRVRRTLEWLVQIADPKGGWSCFGSGRNLDSWEALSAFAVYPRRKWTAQMTACVDAAAGFYLERELHRQGSRYPPWYRFHYYYDLLVGLDFMTRLGYAGDPRIAFAVSTLQRKRRKDGRWNLDAVHPDVGGGIARWFRAHPNDRPIPWSLEPAGRPSKMVTLTALRVLSRIDAAAGR